MRRTASRKVATVISPLGKREESRAVATALAHVEEGYGPIQKARLRVLGAELALRKAPNPQSLPERMVRVVIADYSGRQILQVLLDGKGRVIESKTLHYQVVRQPDEIAEARSIAVRDQRVRDLIRGRKCFVALFNPNISVEQGTRLVGLRYGQMKGGGPPTFLGAAIVDLSTQEVRAFTQESTPQDRR